MVELGQRSRSVSSAMRALLTAQGKSFVRGLGARIPSMLSTDKVACSATTIQAWSAFDTTSKAPRSKSPVCCRTRSAWECSTRSPSELKQGSSEYLPPVADEGGVIIFDWDDTLFPTSWLKASSGNAPLSVQQLEKHARLVEHTLRAARAVAKVAIVTLAKDGWVTRTANEYLPGLRLESLLNELEIEVLYARDENCPGAWEAAEWAVLKRSAMRRVLMDFCTVNGGCRSIISIGDDTIEQEALKGLMSDKKAFSGYRHLPLCKTLKLMHNPTLTQLSEQLQRLVPLLKPMALRPRGFEACI